MAGMGDFIGLNKPQDPPARSGRDDTPPAGAPKSDSPSKWEDELSGYLGGEEKSVSSSNVTSSKYDRQHGYMELGFVNGARYGYHDVSPTEATNFLSAKSKGGWVWDNLRRRGTVFGYQKPYAFISGQSKEYEPKYYNDDTHREEHRSIAPAGHTPASWQAGAGPYHPTYGTPRPSWGAAGGITGPTPPSGHSHAEIADLTHRKVPMAYRAGEPDLPVAQHAPPLPPPTHDEHPKATGTYQPPKADVGTHGVPALKAPGSLWGGISGLLGKAAKAGRNFLGAHFAEGGEIPGDPAMGDNKLINTTPGEVVVNKAASGKYRTILDRMNAGLDPFPHYARGTPPLRTTGQFGTGGFSDRPDRIQALLDATPLVGALPVAQHAPPMATHAPPPPPESRGRTPQDIAEAFSAGLPPMGVGPRTAWPSLQASPWTSAATPANNTATGASTIERDFGGARSTSGEYQKVHVTNFQELTDKLGKGGFIGGRGGKSGPSEADMDAVGSGYYNDDKIGRKRPDFDEHGMLKSNKGNEMLRYANAAMAGGQIGHAVLGGGSGAAFGAAVGTAAVTGDPIPALIAGAGVLKEKFDLLKDTVISLRDPAQQLLQFVAPFAQQVSKFDPGAIERMQLALDNLSAAAGSMFLPIIESVRGFADELNVLYTAVSSPIRNLVGEVMGPVRQVARDLAVSFADMSARAFPVISGIIRDLAPLGPLLTTLGQVIIAGTGWIVDAFGVLATATGFIVKLWNDFGPSVEVLKGTLIGFAAVLVVAGIGIMLSLAPLIILGGIIVLVIGAFGYLIYKIGQWVGILDARASTPQGQSPISGNMTAAAQSARQVGIEQVGLEARAAAFSQGASVQEQQLATQQELVRGQEGIAAILGRILGQFTQNAYTGLGTMGG